MPLQNRVNPLGEFCAVPHRGMFMGNRGVLHDDAGTIRSSWQSKRWIICLTNFKGRRRPLLRPGCYTELFFMDEATALAAGHRPCAECRRDRYKAFVTAFAEGNGDILSGLRPTADVMDKCLHQHRVDATGNQVRWYAPVDELPDGVMFVAPDRLWQPFLKWCGSFYAWSFEGYSLCEMALDGNDVAVLTPRPTLNAITAGFIPDVHPSALALSEQAHG